ASPGPRKASNATPCPSPSEACCAGSAETTRATTRGAAWCERQLLGAGGGAPRPAGGGDIAGRKGALKKVLEISALTVLHVIDVPAPCSRILDLGQKLEKALRRVDIAGLRGDHENRVYPIHWEHADDAAERALGLGLQ